MKKRFTAGMYRKVALVAAMSLMISNPMTVLADIDGETTQESSGSEGSESGGSESSGNESGGSESRNDGGSESSGNESGGNESGNDSGSENGSKSGNDSGSENSSESGNDSGSESGSESGNDSGSESGSETDNNGGESYNNGGESDNSESGTGESAENSGNENSGEAADQGDGQAESSEASVHVDSAESYDAMESHPTDPVTELKEKTSETTESDPVVETKTETTDNTEVHEDGSTTTETITTTTTETVTESTTTETSLYEVHSEGSYTTDDRETADYIAQKEQEAQEALKADVESREEGNYDYSVEVQDNSTSEHVEAEEEYSRKTEAEEAAQTLAADEDKINIEVKELRTEEERQQKLDQLAEEAGNIGGTVNQEETKVSGDTSVIEATFQTAEAAQAFLDKAVEMYQEDVVETKLEEIPLKGKPQNEEDKGYTVSIEQINWNHAIVTVEVTGAGLEHIEIPMHDEEGMLFNLQPGDNIYYTVRIINKAEDDYIIDGYDSLLDGPYKFMLATKFKDEYGTVVQEAGRYVIYDPANLDAITRTSGGGKADFSSSTALKEYCAENGINYYWMSFGERDRMGRQLITEDFLLDYYNRKLGVAGTQDAYTSLSKAYQEHFRQNIWSHTYGEEGLKPADYFNNYKGELLGKGLWEIPAYAEVDGELADNLYQSTVWGFAENLVLKAVKKYKASATMEDARYRVEYDQENHSYDVEVKGVGTFKVTETETKEMKVEVVETETKITNTPPKKDTPKEETPKDETPKNDTPKEETVTPETPDVTNDTENAETPKKVTAEERPERPAAGNRRETARVNAETNRRTASVEDYGQVLFESEVLGVSREEPTYTAVQFTSDEGAVLGATRLRETAVLGATRSPQTGDSSRTAAWGAVLAAGFAALAGWFFSWRKKMN